MLKMLQTSQGKKLGTMLTVISTFYIIYFDPLQLLRFVSVMKVKKIYSDIDKIC